VGEDEASGLTALSEAIGYVLKEFLFQGPPELGSTHDPVTCRPFFDVDKLLILQYLVIPFDISANSCLTSILEPSTLALRASSQAVDTGHSQLTQGRRIS